MKRMLLIMGLTLLVVLASASAALAYHKDGVTVDPHQSYGIDSPTGETDFCLQCHDIHAAAGDYALMWKDTVTNTCATCHGVYQVTPAEGDDRHPGYPGPESHPGQAAGRSVYEVPLGDAFIHEGHRLGQNLSGASNWTYASGPDGAIETEPYTTDTPNFIPGSGFPGVDDYEYLTRINNWTNYLAGGDMSSFLASERDALGGLYCASCHSPHGTTRGNALPSNLTKGKLLSARPNHAQASIPTAGWTSWNDDGYNWCLSCHEQRSEPDTPDGVKPHNHPASFCLECHGDNPAATPDFPHTGVKNLLADYPDELCVDSCHAFGLP